MEKKGKVDCPCQPPNCSFGDLRHPWIMEYKNLTGCIFSHNPQHTFEEELITVTSIYRVLIYCQIQENLNSTSVLLTRKLILRKYKVTQPESKVIAIIQISESWANGLPRTHKDSKVLCSQPPPHTSPSLVRPQAHPKSICWLRSSNFRSQTPYLTPSAHVILPYPQNTFQH